MTRVARALLGCMLIGSSVFAGEAQFSVKPSATKAGDKTRIEFAVARESDVAVYIENAKGGIVRHLVAGVLGLAVTDKYAYVDDVINKRILRVKLGYAVEATCEVK